jgi:hypothetical protein
MDEEEEIEEDKPVDQPENSSKGRAAHLAPWQFKKSSPAILLAVSQASQ